MAKKTQQEELKKTYLNSESGLRESQRQFLCYPNPGLVPCVLEQEKDSFSLIFDDSDLKPYKSVKSLSEADKMRALAGAASLETLANDYSFSLDPDNLLIDINLIPKVLERKIADGAGDFLDQYLALIGCTLQPGYSFKHFLRGGAFLFNGNAALRAIRKLETVAEIKSELVRRSDEAREEQTKKYVLTGRKRARFNRFLIPFLIVITVLSAAAAVYFAGFENPRNQAIIAGNSAYLRQDYLRTQDELLDITIESLPIESQYILARSYVITEGLSNTQRENVLSGITLQSDPRYLCFWIAVGRLDFDSAEDYAGRLGDDELMLYSLCKHKIDVQNDPNMPGAEKSKLIADLTSQIETLEEKLEGKRKNFEEAASVSDSDLSAAGANG
jgi:type VII secretion protein EssB